MIKDEIHKEQKEMCKKYNAEFLDSSLDSIVGVSESVLNTNNFPLHGLRHTPEKNTTGWFIWSGEFSQDKDFFKPVHLSHLLTSKPMLIKYLGLSAGWRFLVTPDYEDVWEDKKLLQV